MKLKQKFCYQRGARHTFRYKARRGSNKIQHYIVFNLLAAFFLTIGIQNLLTAGGYARLNEGTAATDAFRRQAMDEGILSSIQATKDPGKILGLYWLDTDFHRKGLSVNLDEEGIEKLEHKWVSRDGWESYVSACRGIWNDVRYFPVPQSSGREEKGVSFVDSWMYERNYGGKRGHEGTDIMADKNERGLYPVVSMTDGVVRHKGWLEQGGWRLGIVAPGGAYFYYAHMDSYADIQEEDTVSAGDILGYMGDTGYSKTEGTTGNFPVHLHVGIYIFHNDQEVSVNPYWVLKYLESRKLKCAY